MSKTGRNRRISGKGEMVVIVKKKTKRKCIIEDGMLKSTFSSSG